MKTSRDPIKPDAYIALVGAYAALVLSLLDMLGLTNFQWFEKNIPKLSLTLISLVLVYVTQESRGILQSILKEIRLPLVEKLASMRRNLNPTTDAIFGGRFESMIKILDDALAEKAIQCNDVDEFRHFYKRTLEVFSKAHLCATSLPYREYFWSGDQNSKMEEAVQRFIAQGGTMKRIFFVTDEKYKSDAEVRKIIDSQIKMGVETYILDPAFVPGELLSYFVVDDDCRIAWEVTVYGNAIKRARFTMDPEATKSFHDKFDRLMGLEKTHRVT